MSRSRRCCLGGRSGPEESNSSGAPLCDVLEPAYRPGRQTKLMCKNMPDKPQGALKNGTLTKLNLHKTALNGNKRLL